MTAIVKIRKIGNSKGILFPKSILEKSGLSTKVKMAVKDNVITLSSVDQSQKKKWSDFKKSKKIKADFVANQFDQIDWTW